MRTSDQMQKFLLNYLLKLKKKSFVVTILIFATPPDLRSKIKQEKAQQQPQCETSLAAAADRGLIYSQCLRYVEISDKTFSTHKGTLNHSKRSSNVWVVPFLQLK